MTRSTVLPVRAATLALLAGLCAPVHAQEANQPAPATQPAPSTVGIESAKTDSLGRRIAVGDDTILAFPKATVEQIIPFIAECTGKVVLAQQTVHPIRISVVNDKPIPRSKALDMVFFALQQSGVAVIEREDFILLRDQTDIDRQPLPVMGPDKSTLERQDLGSVVQKIFSLKHASASNVADIVKTSLPDKAPVIADNDSSQVVVTAPIALLQRIERLIQALDRPPSDLPKSETFHLKYIDADTVAANILNLFSDTSATRRNTGQPNQPNNNQGGGGRPNFPGGGGGNRGNQPGNTPASPNGEAGSGARAAATPTSTILRAIASPSQNSVTVVAEGNILEIIRKQILDEWDKPVAAELVKPKAYELKYSDPVKLKAILEGSFGTGAAQGGQNRNTNQRLSGQFTFQAIPESRKLLVITKTPDNLTVIDQIIEQLDQPQTAGMPEIIELKHVQAEDLAEQLNALLAQEGTIARVRRVNTELSANGSNGASPFSSEFTSTDTGFSQTSSNTDNMDFWWGRGRPPTDNSGASSLVAKARIVPIAKRNTIMVLAPAEYKLSIRKIVEQLDKPGRQVLIAAIIAEISTEDAMELGMRLSNAAITPTKPDNVFSIGPSPANQPLLTGTKPNILNNLFDTSVLQVGVNANAVIQALAQKTKVNVLSEPRIFTGDNVEANFFDGQDVPFITQNQPATGTTALVQNFDYRAVGINLKVRPRITPERDVDLKVNLELSSIEPNQTLFGGFIVDRRQTTTALIVKDGQTVVISGIMRSSDSDIRRKVPGLGDIPGIGALFTSTDRIRTTTELIAFVTPIVVNNPEDSDKINNPERTRMGELRHELSDGKAPPKPAPTAEPKSDTKPAAPETPVPAMPITTSEPSIRPANGDPDLIP